MSDRKLTTIAELEAELEELRHQLFEANEIIEAIRTGQIDALVVSNDDGHELYTLKTADQAYRVFIENMTEGALTLNREGLILYCNSRMAQMVGQPLANIIGSTFENFLAPESLTLYKEFFEECWTKDCKGEMLLKADDGHRTPVLLSVTALELEDGKSLSIILTDLSAQKLAQRELAEKNRQLAEINIALELSNHDLQQFASVASHDLQEPLRKIQVFSNMLKQRDGENLSTDSRKYVEKIIDSASRMKSLIVEVLKYSKLSARDIASEQIDLNSLIQDLLEDFELSAFEKNATITVDKLPTIEANKGQMRQVFQNIISNSLKFSKKDVAPHIHIQGKRVGKKSFDSAADPNGAYCLITVQDNGIGFDDKYLGQIFTLFERLHSKDTYEGTGIGLAITKKIVDKHNGLVSAKSRPGEGAKFLLLLPIEQK